MYLYNKFSILYFVYKNFIILIPLKNSPLFDDWKNKKSITFLKIKDQITNENLWYKAIENDFSEALQLSVNLPNLKIK